MGILPKDSKSIEELATKLGASYYIDPATNKRVLTSHGLKLLEKCCEKKCSNCPFPLLDKL
jgi:hypothetical protein